MIWCCLLFAAAASAATIDPLLHDPFAYARVIDVHRDAKDGTASIAVILDLEAGLPDLGAVEGLVVGSVVGDLATARLPLSSLDDLAAVPGISHVAAARLWQPFMDAAVAHAHVDDVWNGAPAYTGEGVLVGIIDSGIDWRHADFRHANNTTRIKAIWEAGEGGGPVEWTEGQINAGACTQLDTNGHGTHVAGIAAGDGETYRGVAYEADLVVAKASSDGSFSEADVIDAMDFLVHQANDLGQPIVINMSLGGHFGPHDGTTPQERAVDALSGTGVMFTIAAGNEGEGRIAATGPASDSGSSFLIDVSPTAGLGNDEFGVILWYDGAAANATVTLSVNGAATPPFVAGDVVNQESSAGWLQIVHGADADAASGDRYFYLFASDNAGGTPLTSGQWNLRLQGGFGTAHAWLFLRDTDVEFRFSDDSHSVAMPACAAQAIAVAAYKTRNEWVGMDGRTYGYSAGTIWGATPIGDRAPFSSQGPTRDGRHKPDLAAPGMAILSSYSQDTDPEPPAALRTQDGRYLANQGTSMAAPFVAGVVALMLEKNPSLTAAEVREILNATAVGTVWNTGTGWGTLDAAAALAAVTAADVATGDIDGDGGVTILDVVRLVNHVVDPSGHPFTDDQRADANVVADGSLDIADVVRLVAFVLGTDAPGKAAAPVRFDLAEPILVDGRWWLPVTLAGAEMAGAQFALTADDMEWDAAGVELEHGAAAAVAAAASGDQLRVVIYDAANALPASGLTVRIPLADGGAVAAQPRVTGLLVVDAAARPREVAIGRDGAALRSLDVAPNPAPAGATTIAFQLGRGQDVRLEVFDLKGRRVRAVALGQLAAGPHAVAWDGRDDGGEIVAAGVYLVRIATPQAVRTRKLVVSR